MLISRRQYLKAWQLAFSWVSWFTEVSSAGVLCLCVKWEHVIRHLWVLGRACWRPWPSCPNYPLELPEGLSTVFFVLLFCCLATRSQRTWATTQACNEVFVNTEILLQLTCVSVRVCVGPPYYLIIWLQLILDTLPFVLLELIITKVELNL